MNSLAPSPTSLKLFLDLYSKAEQECNLNYMEGAKALHAWLTSPEYPVLTFVNSAPPKKMPQFLCTYNSFELAKIITGYSKNLTGSNVLAKLAILQRTEAAIIEYYIAKWTGE